jgi:4-amino-4-deoxy-L-arabinose transferase-like glycosyltransferase
MRVSHIAEGGSYLDGIFDNPPLFVYSLALLSKIFGTNIIIFRLFIMFCTLITTYLIYKIGCIIGKKRAALVSSSLFAFFPMTLIFSKIIQIDLFAIMLMTATFYFAVLGIKKERKWFYLSGLFLGLTIFTKFPAAIVILPIFYYMFHKKVEIKYYLLVIIINILIQIPWIIYFWSEKTSFLGAGASLSRNFFGLGTMHTEAPYYQLSMILLAVLVFVLLLILFWKYKPKTIEQKILALFTLIFSGFFVLLPNHEYYLLPVFVPLFLYLGIIYGNVKKEKTVKKILTIFLIISIGFLIIRPIYDVNWQQAVNYVKENYSENVTIYSTAPTVTEYYFNREVNWFHPKNIRNISNKDTIIMFTFFDRVNLEDLNILVVIEEKFILLKSIDDKIFIYGSKDLV